jgi:hypothetical protein
LDYIANELSFELLIVSLINWHSYNRRFMLSSLPHCLPVQMGNAFVSIAESPIQQGSDAYMINFCTYLGSMPLMPDGTLENRIVHAEPILVRLIHQNFSEGKMEMINLRQLKA